MVDSFARYRSLRILMWCVVRAPSQGAAHFSRKQVVTHRSAAETGAGCGGGEQGPAEEEVCAEEDWGPYVTRTICPCS